MSKTYIELRLGIDESLVLFELLTDFPDRPLIEVRSSAERLALMRLYGALESTLVEPFQPGYRELVESARSRLRLQSGDE